jgi:hypothetical protein
MDNHFIHLIDQYPTMPPMTGLPASFAWWARWFFGWFLVGAILRWRLRGILRVAIDEFLQDLHRLAELFDLGT